MKTKPIPDGYEALIPYLIIDGANAAIQFYRSIFGATERMRIGAAGGKVGHAEIMIGGSMMMVADEFPEMDARGPLSIGGSPVSLHLYVKNVDDVVSRAVAAGAKLLRPVETKFYGDRSGTLSDPWGHIWHVSTHVEDVSPEELQKRVEQFEQSKA